MSRLPHPVASPGLLSDSFPRPPREEKKNHPITEEFLSRHLAPRRPPNRFWREDLPCLAPGFLSIAAKLPHFLSAGAKHALLKAPAADFEAAAADFREETPQKSSVSSLGDLPEKEGL